MRKNSLIKGFLIVLMATALLYAANPQKASWSFRFNNAPLPDAFSQIVEHTGISLVFADSLLADYRVTADFHKVSLDSLIRGLLKPTCLSYKWSSSRRVIIFKNPEIKKIDIHGFVLDAENGEPLPFANVWVQRENYGTRTNREGYFSLINLPVKPLRVSAQYIGFNDTTFLVYPNRQENRLIFRMQPKVYSDSGVVVEGNISDYLALNTGDNAYTLGIRRAERLPFVGERDLLRSLQLLPGISSNAEGGSSFGIRGGNQSENLVLLDGITIYHLNHAFGFLSPFNERIIKDLRVYKSGFPSKYGGRVSGIIDLTSKNGNAFKPKFTAEVGQMTIGSSLEFPLSNWGAFLLSARHSYENNMLSRLFEVFFSEPQDNLQSNTLNKDIRFYDVFGKLTLFPARSTILTLSAFTGQDNIDFSRRSIYFSADSLIIRDTYNDFFQYEWGNKGLSAILFHSWNEHLTSKITASHSAYENTQQHRQNITLFDSTANLSQISRDSSRYFINNEIKDYSIKMVNTLLLSKKQSLEFGASLTALQVGFNSEDQAAFTNYKQSIVDSTYLISGFIENQFSLFKDLQGRIGLRSLYNSLSRKWNWEPRISISQKLASSFSLKASYGENHQYLVEPVVTDNKKNALFNFLLADDIYIPSIHSRDYQLGFILRKNEYEMSVEFYRRNLRNLFLEGYDLGAYLGSGVFYQANRAISEGMDILLARKTGKINGWISYAYNNSVVKVKEYEGGESKFPLSYSIKHNFKAVVNWDIKGWLFSATWVYASGKPYTGEKVEVLKFGNVVYKQLVKDPLPNQSHLPSNHFLNVAVRRQFKWEEFEGAFGVSIYNLYNHKNIWRRYFELRNDQPVLVNLYSFGIRPSLFFSLSL
ncbi:MAG: TonB-dependent receptor [Calditrichia bacterium]